MRLVTVLAICLLGASATIDLSAGALAAAGAQRGGRGGRGGAPVNPRQSAPVDLTGYWVSPIIEDWKYRMVTPNKGVFDAVPLNPEGRKIGDSWDPARDEAAGEQCRAYGAAAIMRLPGRLHITWQDDTTLKVETDTGTQTRLLRFTSGGPSGPASSVGSPVEPSWQGQSTAQWNVSSAHLKVLTTNLRPGYLRKNGPPYSARATVTEFWDVHAMPNGDRWLTVNTRVEDPVYLTRTYVTSSDFKRLPDAQGWTPTPCSAR
jgi:hypothetical protein